MDLVLVESPTKSKTLQKFLGSNFRVEASMGHIRDLPKSDLGVDVEHNFEPRYIIPRDKRKRVNDLKRLAKEAKNIWLASDPDREGEAIAWHIAKILEDSKVPMQRVEFHEITEGAIKDAFLHPREIDLKLVDAQQARRILDRLVGYKLSPLLWAKIKRGLSAGRVQSVALRLIVEREREVLAFKAVEYWSIEAELVSSIKYQVSGEGKTGMFNAVLIELDGKKIVIDDESQAKQHISNLEKADYKISKIVKKEVRRFPLPPFTTSTIQQTAANKLGFSSKKTMMLAQALYEQGYITYMRTDSVNLAASSIDQVRKYIKDQIGSTYLPKTPKVYKSKSKNAQEAHEAIRPTNASLNMEGLKNKEGLGRDHLRLYDLIWKRFVACQMNEAVMDQTTVDVSAICHPGGSETTDRISKTEDSIASLQNDSYLFRATGSVIKFDGWLKLYQVSSIKYAAEEEVAEKDEDKKEQVLPELTEGEILKLLKLLPEQHFTQPPPRYNEASLIKKLEELGIGRPSTYAPIISTIQDRFYVERKERKFFPTTLGLAVNDFLFKYFPDVIDYAFTAAMEDSLDEVSRGERAWQPIIKDFYVPFEKKLNQTSGSAQKVQIETEKIDRKCPECGKDLLVRYGKFGKFLACSGFPECKHTEALEPLLNIKCPLDGGEVVVRHTKTGRTFYGCKNYPNCKFASWNKPGETKEAGS